MNLPFPLAGSTLITGPSNAGKTRLTYRALRAWVDREGTEGLVVLEFAPELERDGRVLGGRLDRFGPLPEGAWVGVLDAHAPRAQAGTEEEAVALARENAERAAQILAAVPDNEEEAVALARENAERAAQILAAVPDDPRAVFVNDATIALQHEAGDVDRLTDYCDLADCAVLNAFESDELGTDDPVSRRERAALAALREWADRSVALAPEG